MEASVGRGVAIWSVSSHILLLQDCVFQDLGEGVLENALQVANILYLTALTQTLLFAIDGHGQLML